MISDKIMIFNKTKAAYRILMKTVQPEQVKMSPMLLCLLISIWGCMILPCESVALTSDGIDNGQWILKDHSSVTLVCTISPFTGVLLWRFNFSNVAECTIQDCRQFTTGDGFFSFAFDTAKGVFEWSIRPVDKKKHNGQLFECYDGTNTANVTAVVTESETLPTCPKDEVNCLTSEAVPLATLIILIVHCSFWVLLGIILSCKNRKCKGESNNHEVTIASIFSAVKTQSGLLEQKLKGLSDAVGKTQEDMNTGFINILNATHKTKEDMETELNSLKKTKENMKTEINNLEKTKKDMETEFNSLEKTKKDMGTEVISLKKMKQDVETEVNSLKKTKEVTETEVNSLTKTKEDMEMEVISLKKTKEDMETEVSSLKKTKEDKETEVSSLKKTK